MNKCVLASMIMTGLAPLATLHAADVARERGRPLIGVQRWDMYSGKRYTHEQELGYLPGGSAFLKPAEWHSRAPFFCRLTKDVDWVKHPADAGPLWFNYPFSQELLQKTMDQEIGYAYGAGIDFFIYRGPPARITDRRDGWGLLNNLHCHIASQLPEAKKLHFVWALYGRWGQAQSTVHCHPPRRSLIHYASRAPPDWRLTPGGGWRR